MSRVCRDHPRCHCATWICMCGQTYDIFSLCFIEICSGVSEPQGRKFSLISPSAFLAMVNTVGHIYIPVGSLLTRLYIHFIYKSIVS